MNEKRANAARLPLWMYVLAWFLRTTRLAEHDLNAAPIHGSGATVTGDVSPVKEPTPLELYDKVIAAYQKASLWALLKYAFKEQWWRIVTIIILSIVTFLIGTLIYTIDNSGIGQFILKVVLVIILFSSFSYLLYGVGEPAFKKVFEKEAKVYGNIIKIYGKRREFYRYVLFRNHLKQQRFKPEDVEAVNLLLDIENKISSFYRELPIVVLLVAVLVAVIADLAEKLPALWAGAVVVTGLIAWAIFSSPPTFPGKHKRQYELHRWLAWYKAEAPKASTPPILTPDGANPPPD